MCLNRLERDVLEPVRKGCARIVERDVQGSWVSPALYYTLRDITFRCEVLRF